MRPVLLSTIAVMIWAINTIVSKYAATVIEPAAISFYRWLLAGLILGVFFARPVWKIRRTARPYLVKLFILGMLGMFMYQCLAYVAAQTTTATNMGIVVTLLPLMSLGVSMLLLGEPVTIRGLAGCALSLAGLTYLLGHGNPIVLLQQGPVLGDGLMFLAVLCYALYNVLLKRWSIPLNNWHSLLLQIWCVMPILFFYYLIHACPPVTMEALPLVLYAGIPASIIAPLLWMHGVSKLGPSNAAILINLLPIFTGAIAIAFLGEAMHAYHVIGGGVTLLGVILVQSVKKTSDEGMATPVRADS
jgi:drug/metabolite transporter (DMT)-like permease